MFPTLNRSTRRRRTATRRTATRRTATRRSTRHRASDGSRDLRLLRVVRSARAGKKWQAEFSDGTTTHFGATGYQDYTQHQDRARRANYRSRHRKDLSTNNPRRAGFLSYFLLWGDSTSMHANLAAYRRRFNL